MKLERPDGHEVAQMKALLRGERPKPEPVADPETHTGSRQPTPFWYAMKDALRASQEPDPGPKEAA